MANVTPSELAALLGPPAVVPIESSPAEAETARRWDRFAATFSRALTLRLRPQLRAAVRVESTGQRLVTAETISAAHDARSVVQLWQAPVSLEPLAVILTPALVATFVDRLLGGRAAPIGDEADSTRLLSNVDYRLASRLIEAVRSCVLEQSPADSPWSLTEVSSSGTALSEAWLPDCRLVRFSFELRFVQGGGSLDLYLPVEAAEVFADEPDEPTTEKASTVSATVSESRPESAKRSTVVARFVPTTLSRHELAGLATGDVVLLDATPDQPLEVEIEGYGHFQAMAGSWAGHRAVRLTGTSSPSSR